MKTLVIHPDDRSTDCLCAIYEGKGFDVLRKSMLNVVNLLPEYDRVIMLGHGSPMGLFSVGQFPGSYVIDSRAVPYLKNKPNIYVWCHASDFVEDHKLKGYASGMFISEVAEGHWYKIASTQAAITKSNDHFSVLLGEHLEEPWKVAERYLNPECEVVKFNHARLKHFV